ncbi:MAG TPA: cation diffusion facilitator family transporter [Chloroflexia bacterium]|nr:cation diffusion facilitator family transporter [Chloroflexia bacterium]
MENQPDNEQLHGKQLFRGDSTQTSAHSSHDHASSDHSHSSEEHPHPHTDGHSHAPELSNHHNHEHAHEGEHDHSETLAGNGLKSTVELAAPSPHSHEDTDNDHGHSHDHHDHDDHDHDDHDHAHDHEHGHDHEHKQGGLGWMLEAIPFFHGHSHGDANMDAAMESDKRGIWAVKVSLAILGVTALFQVVIVLFSGSVALLADTIHNFSDALTAVPLWIAFSLSRRPANRRYTYGYGRIEDVAGVVIVGMIFFSAIVAGYESYQKIINPQPLNNIPWVIAASIVGFLGNEAVAIFRMRVGEQIGSAALVADGQHARVDGITSLAVLFGALGVLLGYPLADPIIGLVITVAILFIVKDTALTMWRRLMDAVEPELVDKIEKTAGKVPGVLGVNGIRVRWMGHKLLAELQIQVDGQNTTFESHQLAEEVRHKLFHTLPRLSAISVHVDPYENEGEIYHELTSHHSQMKSPPANPGSVKIANHENH